MQNWEQYGRQTIFNDKRKNGLLSFFLKEYKEHFGVSVVAGCVKCLNSYYDNYLKTLIMSDKIECDWLLHKKYNGIQLGVNGQPVRNGEMTNKIAEELFKKHPHGANLFEIMPDKKEVDLFDLNKKTYTELKELYPTVEVQKTKKRFLEKIAELKN